MTERNIFLGLGSNLGDRVANLQRALQGIALLPATKLLQTSSIYETEPVGFLDQADFLNMVVELSTERSPDVLFEHLEKIEHDLGRKRKIRWGPRIIDIDILYWGSQTWNSDSLQIPHPEVEKRKFVLEPLNEIAAEFEAPPKFVKIETLLATVRDHKSVRPYLTTDEYA